MQPTPTPTQGTEPVPATLPAGSTAEPTAADERRAGAIEYDSWQAHLHLLRPEVRHG